MVQFFLELVKLFFGVLEVVDEYFFRLFLIVYASVILLARNSLISSPERLYFFVLWGWVSSCVIEVSKIDYVV